MRHNNILFICAIVITILGSSALGSAFGPILFGHTADRIYTEVFDVRTLQDTISKNLFSAPAHHTCANNYCLAGYANDNPNTPICVEIMSFDDFGVRLAPKLFTVDAPEEWVFIFNSDGTIKTNAQGENGPNPANEANCGNAHNNASKTEPTTNLCSAGSASTLTQTEWGWTWTCTDEGAIDSCRAIYGGRFALADNENYDLVQDVLGNGELPHDLFCPRQERGSFNPLTAREINGGIGCKSSEFDSNQASESSFIFLGMLDGSSQTLRFYCAPQSFVNEEPLPTLGTASIHEMDPVLHTLYDPFILTDFYCHSSTSHEDPSSPAP